MASDDAVDYKALFLQAEEQRQRAEEQATQEREQREQAEKQATQEREQREQAEKRATQEREQRLQAEARTQRTFLDEYLWGCHRLLSLPIQVQSKARSTKGSINKPTGKLCPIYLREWTDCTQDLDTFYQLVYDHLPQERLFTPIIALEDIGRICCQPLGSEKDLEFYGRLAVERHVQDIIAELCKIPEARDAFSLGERIVFENHANGIDEEDNSNKERAIPDQFCVHHVRNGTATLLTTVEYKPPHKLPVEYLRSGLRPMNLWEEVVQRDTIPIHSEEKLRYNAEQITASTLVQEYHVMITEGLEYSYITNGIAYVLLRVPQDSPQILYYYLCEPNNEVKPENARPWTAVARVLSLCLMSCSSTPRDHTWRNHQIKYGKRWETDLDFVRAQIPEEELRQTPPGSEYVPSSSPTGSPTANSYRPTTRSRASCAPQSTNTQASEPTDSDSDSESRPNSNYQHAHLGRKRNLSELTSSPPTQQHYSRQPGDGTGQRGHGQQRQHTEEFCTQRCLLGLQRGTSLDENCPNVDWHRQGDTNFSHHPISAEHLVNLINQQLDETLDLDCTPFGTHGSYGQPFKITCRRYGYTVLGKGTTPLRWNEVRREVDVYRVLYAAQGSAVPVFLGPIDLKMIYHVHGAGSIQHMLLMGWGGEEVGELQRSQELASHIKQSTRELRDLGVLHGDLKADNMLWNSELQRVLLIDFHRSKLVFPVRKGKKPLKRLADGGKRNIVGKRARVSLCETSPTES